jgi:hypothetical protein
VLVLVTVTLRTTLVAVAGTPVAPPDTVRLSEEFALSVCAELLVSRIRLGFCAVYAAGAGADVYVNWSAAVIGLVPAPGEPVVVTVTSTTPTACGGLAAVI